MYTWKRSTKGDDMSNAMLVPVRHDMVSFKYHNQEFVGEVRRVYDKPKGHLMVVKIEEGKYRSCYLEQCDNMIVTTKNVSQPM
jgi:hypothetical protein